MQYFYVYLCAVNEHASAHVHVFDENISVCMNAFMYVCVLAHIRRKFQRKYVYVGMYIDEDKRELVCACMYMYHECILEQLCMYVYVSQVHT
jgi:hypothetical protein